MSTGGTYRVSLTSLCEIFETNKQTFPPCHLHHISNSVMESLAKANFMASILCIPYSQLNVSFALFAWFDEIIGINIVLKNYIYLELLQTSRLFDLKLFIDTVDSLGNYTNFWKKQKTNVAILLVGHSSIRLS